MFTPRTFSVGDHVKLTRDLVNGEGTYGAGREFRIIDIYERHGSTLYDLRDHELHVLMEVPFEDISWA